MMEIDKLEKQRKIAEKKIDKKQKKYEKIAKQYMILSDKLALAYIDYINAVNDFNKLYCAIKVK